VTFNLHKKGIKREMKIYYCKICDLSGTRYDIRKHLRDYHGLKGRNDRQKKEKMQSPITDRTIAEEMEI